METNPVLTTLPLTSVDQATIQQDLVNLLSNEFTDWTDTQASNNMIMLLEVLSAIFELEYGYINRMAREAFIQYALDYRNVVAHAKALGYQPSYQTPAVVTGTISSAVPVTANTVIPAGTQFNCNLTGVIYQTIEDVTILVGHTTSAPVVLWQQESFTDNYTGTGLPNQKITLNNAPVLPDSVSIIVNGATWNAVANFVNSAATDTVYTWSMDVDGNYTAVFGDNVSGKSIPNNAAVVIQYNVGGGSLNAIGPQGLTTGVSNVNDAGNDSLLSLSAFNTLAAVPGGDAETTAQIAANAPVSLQTPKSLLTLTDVQQAVAALPGVLAAIAANYLTIVNLPHNVVQIFVVPTGYGQPSQDLIDSINELVTTTKPLVIGETAQVAGANYVTLNFSLQVYALPGYNQNSVQNAVTQLLISLFSNKVSTYPITFGMSIFMSVVSAMIQQIPGVRNLVILSPGDTLLTPDQYPILGTVTYAPVS